MARRGGTPGGTAKGRGFLPPQGGARGRVNEGQGAGNRYWPGGPLFRVDRHRNQLTGGGPYNKGPWSGESRSSRLEFSDSCSPVR